MQEKYKQLATVRNLLWLIYIALLGVLLPHTAWAFSQFQSESSIHLAWLLAFVFEASVFAFTHNMVDRIEKGGRLRRRSDEPNYRYMWRRLTTAYLNVNGIGLLLVSTVSGLANVTYTVEFSRLSMAYAKYSVIYYLAFGGILPIISFLFAHILAKPIDTELETSELERRAKTEAIEAKREVDNLRRQTEELNTRIAEAEQQSETFRRLFAQDKQDRIVTARTIWPEASGSAIASITGASPSYVSDVLKSLNGKD